MGVGRRADGDRVNVLGGEDGVDFGDLSPSRLGQGGARRGVRVGDESHLAVGARRDIAAVDLTDPTRPDNSKFHALLLRGAIHPQRAHKKNIHSILT